MEYEVYAVFDRVAGSFGAPQLMINEGTARRWFQYTMNNSGMIATDCALFKLGNYDTSTGKIASIYEPEFVCNYTPTKVGEDNA